MKEKINEHDMTKNMMSIIRGGYKAKLLVEQEETQTEAVDIEKSNPAFKQEEKKIKDVVHSTATVKSITVTKQGDSGNVNMKVVILEGFDGSGVSTSEAEPTQTWVNQDNHSGIYFELDLLKGYQEPTVKNVSHPDLPRILEKLPGYYDAWMSDWASQNLSDYLK